jgi:hypothetical protein
VIKWVGAREDESKSCFASVNNASQGNGAISAHLLLNVRSPFSCTPPPPLPFPPCAWSLESMRGSEQEAAHYSTLETRICHFSRKKGWAFIFTSRAAAQDTTEVYLFSLSCEIFLIGSPCFVKLESPMREQDEIKRILLLGILLQRSSFN